MIFSKQELHRRGDDVTRKGWTTRFYHDFLDSVWREPFINRTSGFDTAGGPDSVIAFDNLTRVFSISPVTNKFAFWQFIVRVAFFKRYELMELELPDQEGLYLIYLFRDEEDKTHKRQILHFIKNPTTEQIREVYLNRVIVAWIYWDFETKEASYFGDSRHGSEWPPQIHWSWHQTLNSLRESGIQIINATYDGDGTQDAHYQFGISSGTLWHEDILNQTAAVSETVALPVWYFDVLGFPRFTIQTGKKFLNTGTGRVAHNSASGGLAETPDMHFAAFHLFATNCKLYPHLSVLGQASYKTLGEAAGTIEAEVATLRQTLPHSNLMHIGSFILQTSDGYTNSAKARVVYTTSKTDTFTTEMIWDEATKTLTLKRNNGLEDLSQVLSGIDGQDGIDGENGITPHIGVNGNWWIGETDTGVPATGPPGENGTNGTDGADGITPHIGANGNWFIGITDTGVSATGPAGQDGTDGANGTDGTSVYTYIAYASDNAGTGFSLTPTDLLKYRAEIHTTTPLDPPTASDFSGATWVKYIGDDGESGGGTSNPELCVDFLDTTAFVYNVPAAMKFTAMTYEDGAPLLDLPLDTALAKYDKLTITPGSIGLVILTGIYI